MHAALNPILLSEIKKSLAVRLPEIKSGTRAQAVARGLGYRTTSALKEILKQQENNPPMFISAFVDEAAFSDFLSHGAGNVGDDTVSRWRNAFLASVMLSADYTRGEIDELTAILLQSPHWKLGHLGYSEAADNIPTAEQKFAFARDAIVDPDRLLVPAHALKEYFLALEFLDHQANNAQKGRYTSEALTLAAIDWFSEKHGRQVEISAGWIIAAALRLELPIKRSANSVTVNLKSDARSVKLVNLGMPQATIEINKAAVKQDWQAIFRHISRSDGAYVLEASDQIAWSEGEIAASLGQYELECPYDSDTEQACYWLSGFYTAEKEIKARQREQDLALVDLDQSTSNRIRDFLDSLPPHKCTDISLNFRGASYIRVPYTSKTREIERPSEISAPEFYSYLVRQSGQKLPAPTGSYASGLVKAYNEGEYEIRWVYHPKSAKLFMRNCEI